MAADETDEALPSIHASRDERTLDASGDASAGMRAVVREQRVPANTGALWALTAALTLGLLGLGYWGYQQQSALRLQLIATQDSFARISEDAAGQIEHITGQVSATESQLTAAEQARHDQLLALQQQLAEQGRQLEELEVAEQQQDQQLAALQAALDQASSEAVVAREEAMAAQTELAATLRTLQQASDAGLTALQAELAGLEQHVSAMSGWSDQLARLRNEQTAQAAEIERLVNRDKPDVEAAEEAILALSARLDREQEETGEALRAIDSFRVQVTRNLNTLQTQISTLQQKLDGR
ncbi:coiled-coil domain-containing protein [Halopseudomonas salegens]|uniref:ATPase n=1 Tax=Halopseudomonas salegens TaxID=1434072 RepID=A0A1H2FXQ7_9GAMM|nr:hypothetical protein [Halopseudomonas salegens]SDU11828.1 hypothetical protein SAMN05216210_1863 [Halopseudomonas salegens]